MLDSFGNPVPWDHTPKPSSADEIKTLKETLAKIPTIPLTSLETHGHEMLPNEDGRMFHKFEITTIRDGEIVEREPAFQSAFAYLTSKKFMAADNESGKVPIVITRIFLWLHESTVYGEAFYRVK